MGSLDDRLRLEFDALADFDDQQTEDVLAEAMRKGRQQMRRQAVFTRLGVVAVIVAVAAGLYAVVQGQGDSGTISAAVDGSAGSVASNGSLSTNSTSGSPTTLQAETARDPSSSSAVSGLRADGQPPDSWVGISSDGDLERVSTDSAELVVSFGRLEGGENRLDAAWSRPGSDLIYTAVCCEPAGGLGLQVGSDIALSARYTAFSGYAAVPSSDGRLIAVPQTRGLLVTDPDSQDMGVLVSETASDRSTAAAWLPARRTVVWIPVSGGVSDVVEVIPLDDALQALEPRRLPIPRIWSPSLAVGQDGKVLVVGCSDEPTGGACRESTAIELNSVDGTSSVLSIEAGSRLGGYDPTGQFLLYVDGSGAVHLRNGNQDEVVGNGYVWASW
jgi:hypothetical protein